MAQNPNPLNTTPPNSYNTTITPPPPGRTGPNMAFILGGLVVLVGIIAYFVFGGPGADTAPVQQTPPAAAVEPAAPAAQPPAIDTAPATGTAPAPADGAAPAPAPGN